MRKLFVLLDDHKDLKQVEWFLKELEGKSLLVEFRREESRIKLFKQYNTGRINPFDCLTELRGSDRFLCSIADYLILNAASHEVKLVPIGSLANCFKDNYVNVANKEMLENIRDFMNLDEAGLMIGYKHSELLNDLCQLIDRVRVYLPRS